MTTVQRMQKATGRVDSGRSPFGNYLLEMAAEADRMVAEAIEARRFELGPDQLDSLGALMFESSAAWFPEVHQRGPEAVRMHLALGIGGEAGEVLDVIKKVDICGALVPTCEKHADGKHSREALADELADCLTYLLNLAHLERIDLLGAYMAKRQVCIERWGNPTAEVGA